MKPDGVQRTARPTGIASQAFALSWQGASLRARRASTFVIRISSFTLSFHIANRRESHHRLADPCQLGRCDYLINIFVSATCFLGQTCP